jgi:hypothetical protein
MTKDRRMTGARLAQGALLDAPVVLRGIFEGVVQESAEAEMRPST